MRSTVLQSVSKGTKEMDLNTFRLCRISAARQKMMESTYKNSRCYIHNLSILYGLFTVMVCAFLSVCQWRKGTAPVWTNGSLQMKSDWLTELHRPTFWGNGTSRNAVALRAFIWSHLMNTSPTFTQLVLLCLPIERKEKHTCGSIWAAELTSESMKETFPHRNNLMLPRKGFIKMSCVSCDVIFLPWHDVRATWKAIKRLCCCYGTPVSQTLWVGLKHGLPLDGAIYQFSVSFFLTGKNAFGNMLSVGLFSMQWE